MVRVAAALLVLSLASAQAQQTEAERYLAAALEAQQRHDLNMAIQDYQRVLKLQPRNIDATVNLGAVLAQAGRFDDAIAQYRLALETLPENRDIRMNLGLAFYKKGELPQAIREFETIRGAEPHNVRLAILLADSEVRSGRATDAVVVLQPMEPGNSDNPDFEFVMGTALLGSGHRSDAVTRLQKVADTTQAPDVLYLAGTTQLDLNHAEPARKDLDVALRLDPKLPRVFTLAGMARDRCDDREGAEADFREALKRTPDDFDANLYLGTILLKRRSLEEAKPYLTRALQIDPASVLAKYENASWESTSGDYTAAALNLEQVIQAKPDWLDPHVELATVYYKLHRPEDGAKQRAIVAKLQEQMQTKGPGR